MVFFFETSLLVETDNSTYSLRLLEENVYLTDLWSEMLEIVNQKISKYLKACIN